MQGVNTWFTTMVKGNFPLPLPLHWSRFAGAGGANITQTTFSAVVYPVHFLSAWMLADTPSESRTTFNFLGVPARLIFHAIKIGRSDRAGKATAMENGLNEGMEEVVMVKEENSRIQNKILEAQERTNQTPLTRMFKYTGPGMN